MLASSSRLDLNVLVGPVKPGYIKTILSGHLPIIIDYADFYGSRDASSVWRMRAALQHRDRVREINFGACRDNFQKFIRATNHHFPALESLVIHFPHVHEPEFPATFLRGPDRSELRLRHLELYGGPLALQSGFLSFVTTLTDLILSVTSSEALFDPSQGSTLLARLQDIRCLRSLDLTTPSHPREFSQSQDSVPNENTVPISELTRFRYDGPPTFLNNLMCGLSAPSLQDVKFGLHTNISLLYLPRVIDDVRKEFRSVSIAFDMNHFHLLSSTHSGEIDHFEPSSFKFRLNVDCSPYLIISMSRTPSTKLAMAEELSLNFSRSELTKSWGHLFSMPGFLRQFRRVRVLRVNPFVGRVASYLLQDDGKEPIMPLLEEVEISISRSRCSDEEYERLAAEALAAFEPCERAGRLVKLSLYEQTQMQFRNARSVMYPS